MVWSLATAFPLAHWRIATLASAHTFGIHLIVNKTVWPTNASFTVWEFCSLSLHTSVRNTSVLPFRCVCYLDFTKVFLTQIHSIKREYSLIELNLKPYDRRVIWEEAWSRTLIFLLLILFADECTLRLLLPRYKPKAQFSFYGWLGSSCSSIAAIKPASGEGWMVQTGFHTVVLFRTFVQRSSDSLSNVVNKNLCFHSPCYRTT